MELVLIRVQGRSSMCLLAVSKLRLGLSEICLFFYTELYNRLGIGQINNEFAGY